MAVWIVWMLCGVALLATEDGSGFYIGGCEEGRVDVIEDSNRSFTCDPYPYIPVQFTVSNDKMETIFSCSCFKLKCTTWNELFNLFEGYCHATNNYYMLKLNGITRYSARILSCNNTLSYARCDFRIIVKPVYSPGDCSVSISNWMAIGNCTLRGMFSLDNNYTCKWRQNKDNKEFGGFNTTLTTYTAVNSRTYTQGVCSFAKSIPTTEGYYTYSVSVSPGSAYYFSQEVYIGNPQANAARAKAGLIGGVVAAVIVVVIIIAVSIVYIVKRRKEPVYDSTRRPENNEHMYADLGLSGRESLPTADATFVLSTPRTP